MNSSEIVIDINHYSGLRDNATYDYMLAHTFSNLPYMYLESKTNRFFLHIENQGTFHQYEKLYLFPSGAQWNEFKRHIISDTKIP